MLELLLVLNLIGTVLASRTRRSLGNPFQIYFLVWLAILILYTLTQHTFNPPSHLFLQAIFISQLFVFLLLAICQTAGIIPPRYWANRETIDVRKTVFLAALVATTFAIPLALAKAQSLAGGENLFTSSGYVRLRLALTEEKQTYGILGYFFVLSFVLTSIAATLFRSGKIGVPVLSLSLASSLLYAYLATGRTFILLLFCLAATPLVITGSFRTATLLLIGVALLSAFLLIAAMTGKGVNPNVGISDNAASLLENLRAYTVAPLFALSELISQSPDPEYGANSGRLAFSLLFKIGVTESPPVDLIRNYAYVPDATNVYTVYEPYFRDFLYIGLFIPPAFLLLHLALYRRAIRTGGAWIFYYSASTYPLAMQFFQDQYMSLASTWIQIAFWYAVFIRQHRRTHST